MISGTNTSCRSPYNSPSSDDSEDDGASDYAAHPRQRPLQNESQLEPPDTMLQRFYETVDAPCQAPCQVACQGSIDDQLDLLTHCRQPMQFLSFFKEHQTKEAFGVEVLPVGAYVLPTFCEYCHAANTSQCSADCRRPALYFQKKRPPFAKPDSRVWDPVTDAHRPPPSPQMTTSTLRQSSWLSMFSHSDGGD